MHVPGETVVALQKTHKDIAKMDVSEDADCKEMVGTIEGIRNFGVKKRQDRPELVVPSLNVEAEKAAKSMRCDQRIAVAEAGIDPHWYLRSNEFKAWNRHGKSSMLWHIEDDESARTFLMKQLCMYLQDRKDTKSLVAFHVPQVAEKVSDSRLSIYRSLLAHFCLHFTKEGKEAPEILNRIGASNSQTGELNNEGKVLCQGSENRPAAALKLLKCACRDAPEAIYILVSIQDSINLGEDVALLGDLWRLLSCMQTEITNAQGALKIFVTCHFLKSDNIPTGIPITDLDTDWQNCLESLRINFRCDRPDLVKAEVGTNMWLEKHGQYRRWQAGTGSGILWLEGEAGCGKSTLLATILQQVEARHYFAPRHEGVSQYSDDFSSDEAPVFLKIRHCYDAANQGNNAKSHPAMLRSILFQLLSQFKELFPSVRPISDEVHETTTGAPKWTMKNLKDAFHNICSSSLSAQMSSGVGYRILLLIDAFDESDVSSAMEAGHDARFEALEILHSCCTSRGWIRFKLIMSSRPLDNSKIRAKLQKFSIIKVHECNGPDVAGVINAKIRDLKHTMSSCALGYTEKQIGRYQEVAGSSFKTDLQLPQSTRTQPECSGYLGMVATNAWQHHDGIILWVKIMFDEMKRYLMATARTIKDVADKLADVPKGLKEFYQKMVAQLLQRLGYPEDGIDSSDLRCAKTLLTWASFTGRILTLDEVRDILAFASSTRTLPSNETFNVALRLNNERPWEAMRQSIHFYCGNFLRIAQTNSPIYKILLYEEGLLSSVAAHPSDEVAVFHLSLAQYFRASKDSKVRLLCLPEEEAQASMATLMRDYLLMSLDHNTLSTKDPSEWDRFDFENFTAHLNDRPLLPYVLRFLPELFRCLTEVKLPHETQYDDFWDYLESDLRSGKTAMATKFLSTWVASNSSQRTYESPGSDQLWRSCLVSAIENGRHTALKTLLALGIDANQPLSTKKNDYPLTLAIRKRSKTMVVMIQVSGARITKPRMRVPNVHSFEQPKKPACRPLKAVIELQDLDMLNFLLEGNVNLGIKGQQVDDTDLWHAFDLQRDDILRMLYEKYRSRFHILVEFQLPGYDGDFKFRCAPAVLDTGSSVNLISYTVVDALKLNMTPESMSSVHGISGGVLQLSGTANVTCRIGHAKPWYQLKFHVIAPQAGLPGDRYLILGRSVTMNTMLSAPY